MIYFQLNLFVGFKCHDYNLFIWVKSKKDCFRWEESHLGEGNEEGKMGIVGIFLPLSEVLSAFIQSNMLDV